MAYFNDTNNTNFYPTLSAPGELDAYPSLNHTSVTEEFNEQAYNTFPYRWGMVGQAGLTANSPTRANYESVPLAASYETQVSGHHQPSYPGNYWPAVGQWPQYPHLSASNQGGPFVGAATSERSAVLPTPGSVPLDYWGGNQSGPSTGTFYTENVHTSHQFSIGPSRTGLMQTGRFQPYGMSRTRPNEYRNAEAGPSTLTVPLIPYVGLPTSQPSGGISETTANAEKHHTITEEEEAPKPKRTRLPRGQGKPRNHRVREKRVARKLCDWLKRGRNDRLTPSFNEALAVAVEIIPTIRPLVYLEPCLLTGPVEPGTRIAEGSKSADNEFERRNVERKLYQELSRYYPLGHGQKEWGRPNLLSNVWRDIEGLPVPPAPSNEPDP